MEYRTRTKWTQEMLDDVRARYIDGESTVLIGNAYGKDNTLIIYTFRKMGVTEADVVGPKKYYKLPVVVTVPQEPARPVKPYDKYKHLTEEHTSRGKTYAQYLAQSGMAKDRMLSYLRKLPR